LPKLTLATKITIGRMVCVPIVLWAIYEGYYLLALAVFTVASVSDAADGYIARHWNQQSVIGSILDPLADKLLLTLTFIVLTASPNTLVQHPAWLTVAVTYRDLMILLGVGIVKWFSPTMQFKPIISSKLTTVFQIATVLFIVLANVLAYVGVRVAWTQKPILALSAITGVFCLVSVLGYYREGVWLLQSEAEEPARGGAGA
jgi:cardiolipin synthase